MNFKLNPKNTLFAAFFIIIILTIGRLAKNNFEFSSFIVAGSDFVDSSQVRSPVMIQNGPGYDGQFFYRYALHPFSFEKTDFGVTVDHPSYRIQRIAYPFFVWIFSLGGKPGLVPIMLVIVNILAFLGIIFYFGKFITLVDKDSTQRYLPLFLSGIYMSFSRDLSEVVELFFFVGTVYYLFKSNYLLLSIFMTLTLFSRDTSVIVLFPLALILSFKNLREKFSVFPFFYFAVPFMLFALWKFIIYLNMPALEFADGYQKIGFPFLGIIDGFLYNLNFTDLKHSFEFLFWMAYLFWNIFLVVIVIKAISFNAMLSLSNENMLNLIYCLWLVFSLLITLTIYIDDWGFVRIFSLWNMIGFLILVVNKKKTGLLFNAFSVLLILLTLVRLIIRA